MRLWVDDRIGGRRSWQLLTPGEVPVFVPDEIRKCVCFVCSEEKDRQILARGTAFFVGLSRGDGQEGQWVYLVTANHVLNRIRHARPDGNFLLRVNSAVQAGALWVKTKVSDWKTHPDVTLTDDAAVLPWAPPPDQVDFKLFPMEGAATEDVIRTQHVGTGDEVFLPGLFVPHAGRERNIPIIRVGNIAAMPDEPVQTKIGPMEAYLVEARSIGGLSGSPVFVNLDPIRGTGSLTLGGAGPPQNVFYLLGLMHGHYDVDLSKLDAATGDAFGEEAINMGIAIVLPVARILEIINGPELTQMREQADAAAAAAHLPTLDSPDPTDFGSREYERFEDLAGKLVNVPKKELDEKRKEES